MKGWIIFLVFLCAAVTAFAHQDEPAGEHSAYDCEHQPEGAITELPGLLGKVARLICMREGQRIVSSHAWIWRYTGSFFSMPNVPAHGHVDSQGMKPPFYFKKFSVEELTADEAAQRSEELAEKIVTYKPGKTLASMTIVKAENNYGHVTRIFMPMQSEDNGWAIVCAPECQPDYVILISKRKTD